ALDQSFDNQTEDLSLPFKEVYIWKVGFGAPRCVTCVGDGPPAGDSAIEPIGGTHSSLPDDAANLANYNDWQPRNLTSDGTKVFFNSEAGLVPEDHGGSQPQIYEYNVPF